MKAFKVIGPTARVNFPLAIVTFLVCSPAVVSGAVTQLFSSAGLHLENDFEISLVSSAVVFDATVVTGFAFESSSSVTTSGTRGARDASALAPMEGTLTVPATAIGLWFGNDDFGAIFNAVLSVYSGASFLGAVSVNSNGNDYVDQFIGLISNTAFDRFDIIYQRPEAGELDVFIDDLHLTTIPEPGACGLASVALLVFLRKRRAV